MRAWTKHGHWQVQGHEHGRIYMGVAHLDLANEVSTDVSGLGVDAAPELCEESDERGAEAEAHQQARYERRRQLGEHPTQDSEEDTDASDA